MLELFAKLNAKRVNLNGGSAQALIDVSDLCGVLAALSDVHSWYIYAMIDQRRSYNMELLHKHFEQVVLQEMLNRKYTPEKVKPREFAEGVTKAVVYAHFHHKGKCKACNGLGRKGAEKCKKCEGKGSQSHTWSERVGYGFPLREDLSRKWYRISCGHYDQTIESELLKISDDLYQAIRKIKKQALQYRREESEDLFDDY